MDEQKLKESGVDRVVTKPFRIEQLMKTVEELSSKPPSGKIFIYRNNFCGAG